MRLLRLLARLLLAFIAVTMGVSLASAAAAAMLRDRLPDDAEPDDDEIRIATVFDSRTFRSEADAFRGGRVITWFGGADVDFRAARLDPAGADLEVWAVFGGLRISVPEDWAVDLHGIGLFGGAGSTARSADDAGTRAVLRIRHRSLFGGLGVTAAPDDEFLPV